MPLPALAIPAIAGISGLASGWLLSGDKTEVEVAPGATYQAAPQPAANTILGLPSWVVLVGGAAAIYFFMRGR